MTDRNRNRSGYKKTKVGWIPKEWNTTTLRDICNQPVSGFSVNGTNRSVLDGEKGVLKLSCINKGCFVPNQNKFVEKSEIYLLKTAVRKNTILISRSNNDDFVGAVCFVDRDYPFLFLSDLMWEVSGKNDNALDLLWLTYILTSSPLRALIIARANGTSETMKKITKPSLMGIRIPLPSLSEQKKISEILSTWDKAIEQTRQLIEGKKKRRKGLMQQLLTGRVRLKGYNKKWITCHLGNLFKERSETNGTDLPLLAITGNRGIILASDIVRKDSSNDDKSRYKKILPGDIGYNTMRMWQGVSAVSNLEGIVSPAYTVCIPKRNVVAQFVGYFFKYAPTIHLFWRYSQGLVADTLNLKYHNFALIKVTIPEINAQQAIAEVLQTADQEINQLETKLQALEKQKRGLMQKLLTGEIRVAT